MLSNIESNNCLTAKEKEKAIKMVSKIDFSTVDNDLKTSVSEITELNSSPDERRVLQSDMVKEFDKSAQTNKVSSHKRDLSHIHIPLYRWSDKPDNFNN